MSVSEIWVKTPSLNWNKVNSTNFPNYGNCKYHDVNTCTLKLKKKFTCIFYEIEKYSKNIALCTFFCCIIVINLGMCQIPIA